jgi:NADH-quinone oxidoreductase subunit L
VHYTGVTESIAWKWMDFSGPSAFPLAMVTSPQALSSSDPLSMIPIEFGALVDPLSLTMLCTVTGVAFLIHCFSTGYMSDERDYGRYFACLNMFVATMVLLVMANNLVMLLIGWGGVGFASYSLIGFWNQKPSAVAAARKAFVINVIGDVGLMVAIFKVALLIGNVRYTVMMPGLHDLDPRLTPDALVIGIGLLVAAYAKSAQLPFHTWLPDAMEGPTPVSALIHAATMVTAGVYLLVRCHPLFEARPDLMAFVAGMGALTAIVAATAALVQSDLKRILAYSTMSQLGYMFMACGVGAYSAAIFHLVAHAFFKALLFLSAGVVIHALHGEQDIRNMGGLSKKLPVTTVVFGLGSLALAGIPPLAGFFSKEAILGSVSESKLHDATLLWIVGLITAGLTAYYIGRAFILTFLGNPRNELHPHLPGFSMEWPLVVLAVLTVVAGFFHSSFFSFEGLEPDAPLEGGAIVAVVIALAGVALAVSLHRKGSDVSWPTGLRNLLLGCWGFDAAYTALSRLLHGGAGFLALKIDPLVSRSLPVGLAQGTLQLGESSGLFQDGSLRRYILVMVLSVGLLALCSFFLHPALAGGSF